MIRLSLWLPINLIVVCNSDGNEVGVALREHGSILYCVGAPHHTSFSSQEVNFSCILRAALLMGDGGKKAFLCLFCQLFTARKNCGNQKGCWGFLSSCHSIPTSLNQQIPCTHTHKDMQTILTCHTYAHCTMQSLISQLQQIRTNVIVFDPKCAGALGKQWHIRLMLGVC